VTIRLLLVLALAAPVQEAGPVTLEKRERFSVLAEEISRATSCVIKVLSGVQDREVQVSLREAGLFQALDAICRAHGNAGYLHPRWADPDENHREIRLRPIAWVDYPSSYSGPFRVFAAQYVRERLRTDRGSRDGVRVHLALLAPPSLPLDWQSGTKVRWSFAEVRDADGRDVLRPPGERVSPLVHLTAGVETGLNSDETSLLLKGFDLDRGLSVLRGSVGLSVPENRPIRFPLEEGREAATPAGPLVVESVKPHGERSWRILLRFRELKEGADLDKVFLEHGRIEHDSGSVRLDVLEDQRAIEIRALFLAAKPGWVELRVREGERKIEVPFEIRDVRFPKK